MTVRHLDRLHCSSGDAYLMRALGLIASGAFLLLWAGLRLTPRQIGA